jgi:peptidoglycan/xylan/chitin deacetylase (PgdA/CDA1 family)
MFKVVDFFTILLNASFRFGERNEHESPGIALGFDDYYPEKWAQHFDLFDRYGAKATFFVNADSVSSFMRTAQSRGHEIGYHTINHARLPQLSREEFLKQTISRMDAFREAGVELTSFSYPFGDYSPGMHAELLKYYNIVRGFRGFKLYGKEEMKRGFIRSKSIDNTRYRSDAYFRWEVDNMLNSARMQGKIVPLTSHNIANCRWGIRPERLEYVFRKCREYGLTFYRYKDLQ